MAAHILFRCALFIIGLFLLCGRPCCEIALHSHSYQNSLYYMSDAWYMNERVSSRTETLQAHLPGLSIVLEPAISPTTLQEFWSLSASDVNTLLEAYGLAQVGSAVARNERQALHCIAESKDPLISILLF